ncbi:hypothetical protein [Mycolicibacterium fortuitum]|uniref:YobI family P-loop NTPase n=1 Tax=Mycolicibacterium fortuitum TaxID=1766 RepID=UPI0012FF96EF|nr:hypothetical protein [Mycolicibacterium fortuitum]
MKLRSQLAELSLKLHQWLATGPRGAEADAPNLRSLSPVYVADQHGDYVSVLVGELSKAAAWAPRNVALTGHYGSGKSSVLTEAQRRLENADLKVINLSLPSLGVGNGRIPRDGDPARDKTNLIQKEIVKQLLYRQKPSDAPSSRFNRLDIFRSGWAYWRAAELGIAASGLALLMKVPNKLRDSLPQAAWEWVDKHWWSSASGILQWLSLLAVFGMTFVVAMWAQRLLQQRFRVTELGAGPAKVALSETSSSYFDEYLDEIVYFFQTSKTAVVIFEDLDRFKDPHIFETLRELNLLLNNAEQTGDAPIRFVYAIRDSIFEQLDVDADEVDIDQTADVGERVLTTRAEYDFDAGETRRLMSTNRTKFFDLVIPMVPFISHRTSRDLIRQELAAIDEPKRPGHMVIDIIAVHITDMRLIKNICNEYEVFCRRILTDDGLKELTADRLFASIVYKNLYLADYEKIRDGNSRLDILYRTYLDWVSHQIAKSRADERQARSRLRHIDGLMSRHRRLGERLQEVLSARLAQSTNTSGIQVAVGRTGYNWSELVEIDFWRDYLQGRPNLKVSYPGVGNEALPFDKVQTLVGQALSLEDWTEEDRSDAETELESALAKQRSLAHGSMMKALGEPSMLVSYRGVEQSLISVAENLFDGADLVLELLRSGFIDENFTLYITQFPGQAISASAMNFIIKAVQPNKRYMEYPFGSAGSTKIGDIEAVIDAEAERLFGGQSVYNIQIFDYLLRVESDRLDKPIARLGDNATSDPKFIDAYLVSGKEPAKLVERLGATWPGIFSYLIGQGAEAGNEDLVDAALSGVSRKVTYALSPEDRVAMTEMLPNLRTITASQSLGRAADIACVLEKMDVRPHDLAAVAEPLRTEVIARSLYPLSAANLCTIVHGKEELLSLDRIKAAHGRDVYPHVLAHLPDYFRALDHLPSVPTVVEREQYVSVLGDVGDASVDAVEEVARRSSAECMLDDLSDIGATLWPPLASAHRLTLSANNVAAYIYEHGFDESIAEWLSAARAIDITGATTPLDALAVQVLNTSALTDESKLTIATSLQLAAGSVAAQDLAPTAHSILPALVQKQIVPDDPEAYRCLDAEDWSTKKALVTASKAFPTYMGSLSLGQNELYQILSAPVPDDVKDVVLDQLDAFESLGPNGARVLAEWAVTSGRTPKIEAIVTLASKAGSVSATPILKLLGAQAPTVDLELLQSALNALGRPYAQLTSPGRDRPRVPISAGVEAVLARLRREGIVSKYDENKRKSVFDISKRHS